ncbi:MAG: apolipoprotein N-acyltransferase [Nitrospiria bacterium]
MRVPSSRYLALAALSGALLVLSFPLPRLTLLAWFALVPLLIAASQESPRRAFVLGWIAGVVYFTGTLHWLTNTMVNYGHLPPWLSYPILLLLTLYLGLYVGGFAWAARTLADQPAWRQLVALPAIWTALEFARGHLLTGFPWAALGYSQAAVLPLIQIADLTGVAGVSYVLVFTNVALAQAVAAVWPRAHMSIPLPVASIVPPPASPASRSPIVPLAAAVLVLNGILAYGHRQLEVFRRDDAAAERVTVAVVQGNIDQDQKWDPAHLRDTTERYQALTREQTAHRPDLVVWPEAAMPFFFEREDVYRGELVAFVEREGVPLLFGSPALEMSSENTPRLYNSAYLLSSDGRAAGRYDKLHLVPFGEYVPLSSLLFFVDKLVDGIGEFVPGERATVFDLERFKLGVMICFEVVFPDLPRRAVLNGATVMAAITNDAWFGPSAAPYQHIEMVVFRAVENRVPFARAANTGVSGFIDATGRLFNTTDLFVPATRAATLAPRTRTSFYTRYGDLFAWLCAAAGLLAVGRAAWTRGRPAAGPPGGIERRRHARMPPVDPPRKEPS